MAEDAMDETRMSFSYPFPLPDRLSAPSPSRIDEGFSENPSDAVEEAKPVVFDRQAVADAWQWLLSLDDPLRSEFAHNLLLSLPNASISRIVRDANRRLHFDPVQKLPPEILSHIFEHLEPAALVHACAVSAAWKDRAYEPRLWRRLFRHEGWSVDRENVSFFEQQSGDQIRQIRHFYKASGRVDHSPSGRHDAKRCRSEVHQRIRVHNGSLKLPSSLKFQDGVQDVDAMDLTATRGIKRASTAEDEDMPDALMANSLHEEPTEGSQVDRSGSGHPRVSENIYCPLLKPPEFLSKDIEDVRLNWQYLYNQRRRLEQNWSAGRFINFRLPHPDHPSEAHTQCIYTIQFSANYLVSGSRDKTIRVWDMHTHRLKYPPLVGHSGSVLCLQFDEKEGIIISGGSDSHIIIWELETGKMYKKMENAHSESVLNLRFDDRYLVTCSKDRTIKLWNRKAGLLPNDPEYPGTNSSRDSTYPSYIVKAQNYNKERDIYVEPLPDYSLLMQFEGHHAAVNAIQIFKNEIVSASGDRKIMLWDIRTGNLVRTFTGHSKGIACVQYDGRRVVSGSSDNSVRIFDSSTAAEVAVLEGHRNLVRTVQAEFGDVPGDEESQEAEARENDRKILMQRRVGGIPQRQTSWPQRYFVYGAKLPPGGGANKWSKIVSGSYDETVMIWRMDKDGRWNVAKELRQEDAMRATASSSQPGHVQRHGGPSDHTRARQRQRQVQAQAQGQVQPQMPGHPSNIPPNSTTMPSSMVTAQYAHANAANLLAQHQQQQNPAQAFAPSLGVTTGPSWPASTPSAAAGQGPAQPSTPQAQHLPQQAQLHVPAHHHPQHPHFQYQGQNTGQIHNQAPAAHATTRETDTAGISRVFKLQFDARRIICCSQQPVIVGWDFANGDKDIIEASQFFGEPS